MHVFVTGGTGALGRPVVKRLVAAGHRVRALARSEENVAALRALGAEPVRADLYDAADLHEALAGADAVLHLATRIPGATSAGRPAAWRENDRIRREGTRNLVDAALATGVKTFVYPSVVLVYPDSGDRWIDAATAPAGPESTQLPSTLEAEAEVARFTDRGGRGIVLRMGQFYGDDPYSRSVLGAARRGIGLMLGDDEAFLSFIWIDDAADAVIAALDEQVPAGTYDVVDDEPLRRREVSAALLQAVGRRRLWRVPSFAVRLMARSLSGVLLPSRRVSNRRFRAASGWAPRVPSAREGWRRLAAELNMQSGHAAAAGAERWAKVWLAALLAFGLPMGLWQQVAPRSFYDDFPGLGHMWVSPDGPFNEHLVRDVGGLTLALAAVAFMALVWTTPLLVRAVAVATLVSSVPHVIYHAAHIELLPATADQVAQTLALAAAPALALALLWCAERMQSAERGRRPAADAQRASGAHAAP
jgi:nucleoside-diphosphate-sugar epimerase